MPLSFGEIAEDTTLYMALLEAEDRRAPTAEDLDTFRQAFLSPHTGIRRAAARGYGRLERPALAVELVPLLSDPEPRVRAEAANALTQSVRPAGGEGGADAMLVLIDRLTTESDDLVRSVLARSVGRLPVADSTVAATIETALLEASRTPNVSPAVLLGIARGAGSFYRGLAVAGVSAGEAPLQREYPLLPRLEELAADRALPADVRRMAVTALAAAGPISAGTISSLLDDPDAGVRRLATGSLAALAPDEETFELLERALHDPAPEVRLAAVPLWGRSRPTGARCEPLLSAVEDSVDLVALAGMEALASACLDDGTAAKTLIPIASALPAAGDTGWHRPTAAFLSLVASAPEESRALLARYASHPNPFVRAHAARAAGGLGDDVILESLAGDPSDNVRHAAVTALVPLVGRAADPPLISQLDRGDPRLLMTAARLLRGSHEAGVAPALFSALDRLTALAAPTTRDARVALLGRIAEFGVESAADTLVPRLEPYLRDIDPVIAARTAAILEEWTGRAWTPAPIGLPTLPTPTLTELRALESTRYRVEMASGATFTVRLFPFEAPTAAARFAGMARDGDFDGLTFHRVAPNFVIQGGSPGANEYAGHGEYSRDETGLIGHWRGTLGISTRGRDTGDGQIFVNLIDNLRLDHDYTVFGEIIDGRDEPASVLEGAVIRRIRPMDP